MRRANERNGSRATSAFRWLSDSRQAVRHWPALVMAIRSLTFLFVHYISSSFNDCVFFHHIRRFLDQTPMNRFTTVPVLFLELFSCPLSFIDDTPSQSSDGHLANWLLVSTCLPHPCTLLLFFHRSGLLTPTSNVLYHRC